MRSSHICRTLGLLLLFIGVTSRVNADRWAGDKETSKPTIFSDHATDQSGHTFTEVGAPDGTLFGRNTPGSKGPNFAGEAYVSMRWPAADPDCLPVGIIIRGFVSFTRDGQTGSSPFERGPFQTVALNKGNFYGFSVDPANPDGNADTVDAVPGGFQDGDLICVVVTIFPNTSRHCFDEWAYSDLTCYTRVSS